MKRFAALLLACVLLCVVPAHADEASRRVKARELLTLLQIDRLTDQVTGNMMKQMNAMAAQLGGGSQLSPEKKAQIADFQQQIIALVQSQVSWKVMEPQYVDLYASTYTEQELDALLVFYKTPAGAAVIAKTPELTARSQEMAQARLAAIQPQLMQMVKDFAAKTTPAAVPAPPPPPPPPPPPTGTK